MTFAWQLFLHDIRGGTPLASLGMILIDCWNRGHADKLEL
jgi:hypothetical protein